MAFFTDFGFVILIMDPSILIRHDKDGITKVSMYVDEFLLELK